MKNIIIKLCLAIYSMCIVFVANAYPRRLYFKEFFENLNPEKVAVIGYFNTDSSFFVTQSYDTAIIVGESYNLYTVSSMVVELQLIISEHFNRVDNKFIGKERLRLIFVYKSKIDNKKLKVDLFWEKGFNASNNKIVTIGLYKKIHERKSRIYKIKNGLYKIKDARYKTKSGRYKFTCKTSLAKVWTYLIEKDSKNLNNLKWKIKKIKVDKEKESADIHAGRLNEFTDLD